MRCEIGSADVLQFRFDFSEKELTSGQTVLMGRMQYILQNSFIGDFDSKWYVTDEVSWALDSYLMLGDRGRQLDLTGIPSDPWYDKFRSIESFVAQSAADRFHFLDMVYGAGPINPFLKHECEEALYDLPAKNRGFPQPFVDFPARAAKIRGPFIYRNDAIDYVLWENQDGEVFENLLPGGYADAVMIAAANLMSKKSNIRSLFPQLSKLARNEPFDWMNIPVLCKSDP